MARATLIILAVVLAGCQTRLDDKTSEQRVTDASVALGQSQATTEFPPLSPACTAKVGRAVPGDEPWVITNKRWEILAENRNQQAKDCAAWGESMRQKYGGLR